MDTLKVLQFFFSEGKLPDANGDLNLESKKELKKNFKFLFKDVGDSPLLAFQVLYHRLKEIAEVAKDVFYEDAVKDAQTRQPDDEDKLFGSKVTVKTQEQWDVIPSPKVMKLKKEITTLEKKNEATIKAYESYQIDVKSLTKQIKEEEKRLIEKGMGKKKGEKHIISLKY